MSTINITTARKDLYNLIENTCTYHEPNLIVGRNGNAVLISEDDWNAIEETLYLDSIPHMTESIIAGAKERFVDLDAAGFLSRNHIVNKVWFRYNRTYF